jgi:midasin (ATPase involved in ribosome maturation)
LFVCNNFLFSKVKAVKLGHILVVDEADKAPTNVTCILKTLVENGEMILADGRRIVASEYLKSNILCNICNFYISDIKAQT